MLVWGGQDTTKSEPVIWDGARYYPDADKWEPMSAAGAPSARWNPYDAFLGARWLIWGGDAEDGAAYDPASDSWAPLPPSPSMLNSSVGMVGDTVLQVGGHVEPSPTSAGASLEVGAAAWVETNMSPVLSAREGHSAVGLEAVDAVVVFGGTTAGTASNQPDALDGARWSRSTGTWTAIAPAAVGRTGHAAVALDPERMLVFGGTNAMSVLNSGGVYNATTDSWTALSTTCAPLRLSATLTNAGPGRAILWGGVAGNGDFVLESGYLVKVP